MIRTKKLTYDVNENGCWTCTSHVSRFDKPELYIETETGKKQVYIDIIFYEKKYGKIEPGKFINHSCKNARCINPDHAILSDKREKLPKEKKERKQRTHKEYEYEITDTGCHIMTQKVDMRKGVPQTGRSLHGEKRKKQTIFRYLYQLKYGQVPDLQPVFHTCRNKACINPDHGIQMTIQEYNQTYTQTKIIDYYIDENNCHICTSHSITGGHYPTMVNNGQKIQISRYILEQKLGRKILPKMEAMHLCDNRACINPNHIIEGTHTDNINDAVQKGRMNPPRKLSSNDIIEIRKEYHDCINNLAVKYDVTNTTIKIVIKQNSVETIRVE